MAVKHQIPPNVVSNLIHSALEDPQLPRNNPTEAFWQIPASGISHTQSAQLPATTTYAIIGSGVTGCSTAKNLLDSLSEDSTATVTVFEARTLTSGATGRNGGHLLSPFPEEFTQYEKHLGRDEATQIARFANRTLESMYTVANGDPRLAKDAEARKVRSVVGYYDSELFEEMKESHRRYEQCVPEAEGDHEVVGSEEALQRFNMKDTVGVITHSAGAFWPYRFVTSVFSDLLERYSGRFSIETETPVTNIQYDITTSQEHPYVLSTPQGSILASTVIHCTNGWTGHLLPNLRGKIFPLRGTMSTQEAGSTLPREGDQKSWSVVNRPEYDATEGTFSYGLYYITQNAGTGDLFVGGEKQKITELLSSDDATISTVSKKELESILPTIFDQGWPEPEKPNVRKLWSGIMGFTPDHMPWVGQIPSSVTSREGNGEWIAAGFNGYGMPLCWGCGEAIAKMILGKKGEVEGWLPESFVISHNRLSSPYTTIEAGIAFLLGEEPSFAAKV